MKKLKYLSLFIFLFTINLLVVYAAPTYSVSLSKSKIESNQSVTATLTLKNAASWDVTLRGTGNTNGCSQHEADASSNAANTTKTIKITCSANSTGLIKIIFSGDATSADGTTVGINGTKTVTVVAPTPKSNNNDLAALSIEGGVISPEFNKNTLEYTSVVEAGTEKILINAQASDSKASVSGNGEQSVVEGENRFEIKVTSESGQVKTYILIVTVKEFDPIVVNINGKDYTVVRKLEELKKPESFIETTVTMDDDTVPAFYSEITKKTLIGLKDEDGNVNLYEYVDGKYYKYVEVTFNQVTVNIINMVKSKIPKHYNKFMIDLNGEKIEAYKVEKKSNFAVVYGVDVLTGEKNLYQIDLKNNTIQLFNTDYNTILNKYIKCGVVIGGILLFIVILEYILILLFKRKKSKIIKKLKKEKIEKVKQVALDDAREETVNHKKKKNKIIEKQKESD